MNYITHWAKVYELFMSLSLQSNPEFSFTEQTRQQERLEDANLWVEADFASQATTMGGERWDGVWRRL